MIHEDFTTFVLLNQCNTKRENHYLYMRGLLITILLYSFINCAYSQGLGFKSNDFAINERTSYSVFGTNTLSFNRSFTISFDLFLSNKAGLGYIFRLKDAHSKKTYSFNTLVKSNLSSELFFNIENEASKIRIMRTPDFSSKGEWMHVIVTFDLKTDSVTLRINDKNYGAKGLGLKDLMTPQINFGKNEDNTDVPEMVIKNLVVGNKKSSFRFLFNESAGEVVHDNTKRIKGIVKNPTWMITKSYFWEKRFNYSLMKPGGCSFNPDLNCFMIYTNDSVIQYYPDKEITEKGVSKNPLDVSLILGKNFYQPKTKKNYTYELCTGDKITGSSIAAFDFQTKTWQTIGKARWESPLHHHVIFQREDGETYLFGGYGHYLYSNRIIHYNQPADSWENIQLKGDSLPYRFYSACNRMPVNDKVYFFGGFGNATGEQIIGGKHYYDCFELDLKTFTVRKLWEITEQSDFVPANDLVFTPNGSHFYTMCYAHYNPSSFLTMNYYDVKTGNRIQVGDSIPLFSDRIETDINLYYSSKSDQYFVVSQAYKTANESEISIYSLNNKPVTASVIYHSNQIEEGISFPSRIMITGLILCCLALAGIILTGKKRRKQLMLPPEVAQDTDSNMIQTKEQLNLSIIIPKKAEKEKRNAVLLFGKFSAFDEKGTDISHLFSPQIRFVFIQIMIETFSKNQGLSSTVLSSILWPNEEPQKIKNRKGVLISALRKVVMYLNGIELIYLNGSYSFALTENFYCDYADFMMHKDEAGFDILPIVEKGDFLESCNTSEQDNIKAEIDSVVLEILEKEIMKAYLANDFARISRCAAAMLKTDPFSETGLKWLLQSYMKTNRQKEIVTTYESFCSNYKKYFETEYSLRVTDILKM